MPPWETFFREKIKTILKEKKTIVDIGGGLRISKKKGNRFEPSRAWILEHLTDRQYLVLDPVPDYDPDIIGDIHHLPFSDNSQEAILCLAVLEHIENPIQAVGEVKRVLAQGGQALFYVPFLFYYHAEPGYYKDYWRFTHNAVEMLFRDFSHVEMAKVRGAIETWIHISPLGRFAFLKHIARFLDKVTGKKNSNQVSGYYVFAVK